MTESKEKLDNAAVEEMLRRNMPVLDAPQSLSQDAVAAYLESNRKIRHTPVYIIVRTAVAAVLTLAVGIGAMYAIGSGRKKDSVQEAKDIYTDTDGYSPEESFSYSYKDETKPSYMSDSEDDGAGTNGSNNEPVQNGTEGFDADKERMFIIQMDTGEEQVIETDIAYSETLEFRMTNNANEDVSEADTCLITVCESGSGTVEIHVKALSKGSISFELLDGEYPVMKADIVVNE